MDATRSTGGDAWHVTTAAPTPAGYARLCAAVGWDRYADEARAAVAIANSLAHATVSIGDELVGMGRVVGDAAIFFYLQDIAVDPDHQGRGIGTAIVASLLRQVEMIAPPGSFVGLFSAPRAAPLYERVGFERSESGMSFYLPWGDEPAAGTVGNSE